MDNVSYKDILKLNQDDFDNLITAIRIKHAERSSYLNDSKKGAYCCTCTAELLVLNKRDFDRSIQTLITAYSKLKKTNLDVSLRKMIPDVVESATENFKKRIIH